MSYLAEFTPIDYFEDYVASREKKHAKSTAAQEKELTARHFTELLDDNGITTDTAAPYEAFDIDYYHYM